MARGLTSQIKSILAQDEFSYVDLLELHFPTPVYLLDGPFDKFVSTATSGGVKEFLATGEWLGYSNTSETGQPRVNTVNIILSGTNSTFLNQFLNNPFVNTRAVIYRLFVDEDTYLGSPVMIWDGEITSYQISDTSETTQIQLTTSSVFYDFERVNCRRTNSASQQALHPRDKGMEFATVDISDIRWGKKV